MKRINQSRPFGRLQFRGLNSSVLGPEVAVFYEDVENILRVAIHSGNSPKNTNLTTGTQPL